MAASDEKILNINVGVLGHVDSGKTSLTKALSTLHSTAAFDKSPQSQERGITLDLGFSAFVMNVPERLKAQANEYTALQYTLVDCPGHASLIRTIIGGAQIIDLMILVIDVTKGIQTQTAECLVIGEILMDSLLIVLNKVDLIPKNSREAKLQKLEANLRKALQPSKFRDCKMIPVSATTNENLENLIKYFEENVEIPKRILESNGPLWYAIDHCFSIKGKGTIVTGTVLSGQIRVGETVEIPTLGTQNKVKSMQMFHKAVQTARQGDRVGVNLVGLNAKDLERGLICTPGSLQIMRSAIVSVERVRYYKGSCRSGSGFHITVLHSTVMATGVFFSRKIEEEELSKKEKDATKKVGASPLVKGLAKQKVSFDFEKEYDYVVEYERENPKNPSNRQYFAYLEFETPLVCDTGVTLIGSRMDTDIHKNTCRLAFNGTILSNPVLSSEAGPASSSSTSSSSSSSLPWPKALKVVTPKVREGKVDRIQDDTLLIGTGLFKKETDLGKFTGMKVRIVFPVEEGQVEFLGTIEGGFGKSGKIKVRVLKGGLMKLQSGKEEKGGAGGKKGKGGGASGEGGGRGGIIYLEFKKMMKVKDNKMYQ